MARDNRRGTQMQRRASTSNFNRFSGYLRSEFLIDEM